MSLVQTLKEKATERKKIIEQAGAMLTTASKEKRSLTAPEFEEWNKRHADGDALERDIEALQKQIAADAKLNETREDPRQAGRGDIAVRENETREQAELREKKHSGAMRVWMAQGREGLSQEQREILAGYSVTNTPEGEVRALSAVAGSAGAYTIPTGFQNKLEIALKAFGGMAEESTTIPTEMGNELPMPSINDTSNTGEVIGENQSVAGASGGAAEQDPSYGVTILRAYMLDSSIVKVPIGLLEDSAFDVEVYMSDNLMPIRLGRRINNLLTLGTGANQPTGIVNVAPVGVTTASATAFTYNELLNLEHSVDPAYRPGAKWMFNDSTLKALKQLTDSNSRPLFIAGGTAEGIQNKAPDTIDGYPYSINQDMPSLASLAIPMIFGDLKKYMYRKVRNMQIVRFAERFMTELQIGFLMYVRIDGTLLDAGTHPVKAMACHN